MKLSETGLTAEELKGLVKKYMIETYERFDFIAETARICISMTKRATLTLISMQVSP